MIGPRMMQRCVSLGLIAAVAAFSGAVAQTKGYAPSGDRVAPGEGYQAKHKTGKPAPRTADGKPDLNGTWTFSDGGGPGSESYRPRFSGAFEADQVAMQRGNAWNKPLYKPELWGKVRSQDFSKVGVDPSFACGRPGVPRLLAPVKIVQLPQELILYYVTGDVRFVPLDDRKLTASEADEETFHGVSAARWDKDTLVIDSVGFTEKSWLAWQGYFHSNRMKVSERLWREGDTLFYQFTVDDPEVLVEPWTSDTYVRFKVNNPRPRIEEIPPCQPDEPFGDLMMRG